MPSVYIPRLADGMLAHKLASAGAVHVRGPKWCGKTATSLQQAASVLYMQDPDQHANNMLIAQTKPSLLLRGAQPRLIDEWQVAPQLWDAVRFAVDREGGRGHYILTGSAVPAERPMHTGTGRFGFLTMRTMALAESGESTGEVSIRGLFDGAEPEGFSSLDIERVAYLVARGGWPEAVMTSRTHVETALAVARNYIDAIAEEDVSRVDGRRRDPFKARLVMRALARSTGAAVKLTTVQADVASDDESLSVNTIADYVSALRSIYVLEDLEAWTPALRSKTAIRTSPTRYFTDPSIAAAALGASPDKLLADFETLGLLFESLCVRDLRVYVESMGGCARHYRDRNGLEADVVLTLDDGRWALVEVKLGAARADEGAANLLKLASKVDEEKMGRPSFLVVVTGTGYAYRRPDGVCVVPIGCLTA